MSTKLHNAVIAAANHVRTTLGDMDISSFCITIEVSGRNLTDADECKIEYTVSNGKWGDHSVKGDSIEACLEELKRRIGWHKRHQPTAISAPRTSARAKAIQSEWLAEANIHPPAATDTDADVF